MIYIAAPYSLIEDKETLMSYVNKYTVYLANSGKYPYSPLTHWHYVANQYQLPTSAKFWHRHNMHMLRHSKEMHIIALDGWLESAGVTAERKLAELTDIDIHYVDPAFIDTLDYLS